MSPLPSPAPATVVHVLPADLSRGAQLFARTLRDQLDGRPDRHRTLAVFASDHGQLRPDVTLGVVGGRARRAGFHPGAGIALRRELSQLAPDVVVAHGGESLKYVVVARPRRAALVYTKTGVSSGSLHGRPHTSLYRFLAAQAALVAAVSEESAAEAVALLRVPPERVRFIANGRNPSLYHPRPDRPSPSAPVHLLYVGHLTSIKAPDRFIEVIRRLRAQGVDVDATIVGDGPLLTRIAADASAERIAVLGRRDDVPDLLRAADILVFPGRPEGEGMPGVFIEAGLSGLPVVATDVPGASTVIDHGVTGCVVPVGDYDLLVEAVAALATDATLRQRMGAAARRRCVERWSLEIVAGEWQVAFDEVLGRQSARAASA